MPYISKIEMRGFKSFGNPTVSFPLSKGLTAIVGPNGMGKSNIVDGLCFVLGELSAKAMRAERLSGLLFRGGNGQRQAPFAEVSLHFNNEDGKLPVNSPMVEISRRVDRSGSCVYRINNRRANRQEIIDLLAASMVSPGGYNFVMQGDVSRFVNMGSLERRLIIDDLAGVAEYEAKKRDSMAELQKVETNLTSVEAVLRTISGQMESLRAQREAAIRCKELKLELEQTRGVLLLIKQGKHEKKLSRLNQRTGKLEKEVKTLQDKHQAIADEKAGHEKRIKEFDDRIEDKRSADILLVAERARTQLDTLGEMLKTTTARQSEIMAGIAATTEQIKKMGGAGGKTPSDKISLVSSKFESLRERFGALSKSLGETKSPAAARSLVQKIREVLDEFVPVINEMSKCLGQVSRLPAEPSKEPSVVELRDELIGMESTRKHLDDQLGDIKKKMQEAKSRLENASALEKEIRVSIETLYAEKKKLREKVYGLDEKARDVDNKLRELGGRIQTWRVQEATLTAELNNVKDELKKIKIKLSVPAGADPEALERRAQTLEGEIASLGEINSRAIRDFRESERQYNAEKLNHDKLVAEKQSLLDFMRGIDEKKKDVFMKTFNEISRHFTKIFSELSPSGTAELVLENNEIPFEGGLEIKAMPGGTEVSYVGELSGGQKALTALAFIFALQRHRPTTFYVLDEIDSNLDPQNRKRVADMLRKFSRESQILVITLHDSMMAVADRLFGVTKDNGISRLFSVELSGLES